jgi:GT2 family glycosyltransferase
LGFSKGNNQGIKHSLEQTADHVLLLNNDTEAIQKEWLKKLIKTMEEDKRIGPCPAVLLPDGGEQPIAGWVLWSRRSS